MEAWQNDCPVVNSDQTPWRKLSDKKIGWDISLDKSDTFVEVIEQVANGSGRVHKMVRKLF